MTIEDYCISLNPNNFFLVVLGVVDMCHDLLNKLFLKGKTRVIQYRKAFKKETDTFLNFPRAGF